MPKVTADLDRLLAILPTKIRKELETHDLTNLVEVVLDLGRKPEARFPNEFVYLGRENITKAQLDKVIEKLGTFGNDNRAGIERTLHRISAIRNRNGEIIGLTCRVGRAVFGTIDIIRDLIETGRNVLLLGRPGVGKTTMLREVARVLADEFSKRVVIVDTSNEIAGDGDIPHPAIGRARRMQVPTPERQHDVMIEAVENHMPEVIVIDEIGTSMEAEAARTIAERGVQLIGTAHGNTLENLVLNPTLSDLVGGIQTVTLGDEEARKRGTQKTVLERKAPPTFDIVIEIQGKDRLAVHSDTSKVVDLLLRGIEPRPEVRVRSAPGKVEVVQESNLEQLTAEGTNDLSADRIERAIKYGGPLGIFPYGVSRSKIEKAASELGVRVDIMKTLHGAHIVLSTKGQERKNPKKLQDADRMGIPVYVVRSNTKKQIKDLLANLMLDFDPESRNALREAQEAANHVLDYFEPVELSPQSARLRKLQHELVKRNNLKSKSLGKEPNRRVMIYL